MTLSPHIWVTENNRTLQTVVSIGATVVGLLLTIGSRQTGGSSIETRAAFLLGLLLLVVGLGTLIFAGQQTVTVDAKTQRISLEHKNRFRTRSKHIRFNEIADAYVDECGDNEGGSMAYHVVLQLKSGQNIALFNGFFDGRYNKSVMEAHRQRLMGYISEHH